MSSTIKIQLVTVVIVLMYVYIKGEYIDTVVRDTREGPVMGRRRKEKYSIGSGADTDVVDEFLGVPYAAAPTGRLRFKPPQSAMAREHTFNASEQGMVCPQHPYYQHTQTHLQSEDCLNLNIYSPVQEDQHGVLYPVMVYIHGGSYEDGAGIRYDGFTLAQHGVVVVTINYRLGALGFLTTGDDRLPGNYGFLDQVAALRWIRDNIASFKGHKDAVTLFGNSAGGSSIGLHLISNISRGLYHRVIMQSGSPLSFWAVYNSTVDHAHFVKGVANQVGCTGQAANHGLLQCLIDIKYERFIDEYWNFPRIVPSKLNFKPRIDHGDLFPLPPLKALEQGVYNSQTPVMTGVLDDEWARSMGFFFTELNHTGMDKDFLDGFKRSSFEAAVHHVVTTRFYWPDYIADMIIFQYTKWGKPDPYSDMANRDSYKEFMSDLTMVAPQVQFADLLTSHNHNAPVYFYSFKHLSDHTDPSWWETYHSLELNYVFGSPFTGFDIAQDKDLNHTEEDREVSRRIMKLWTDFAKNGSPASTHVWPQYKKSGKKYLHITSRGLTIKQNLRAVHMAFWNPLVQTLLIRWDSLQGYHLHKSSHFLNCWTVTTIVVVIVVTVLLVLSGLLVHYVRLRQKLEKITYLNNCQRTM